MSPPCSAEIEPVVQFNVGLGWDTRANLYRLRDDATALGVFVPSSRRLAVGTWACLTLYLPDCCLELCAFVEFAGRGGLGLALSEPSARARYELRRFAALRPPLVADDLAWASGP